MTDTSTVYVTLADDPGRTQVPLRWVQLPAGRAGLLLSRWPDRRSTRQPDEAAGMTFQPVDRSGLTEAAVAMAHLPHIRSVVICPVGEAPLQAAVAVAVGDLLTRRSWPEGAGIVTGGTQPPPGSRMTVIPR